MRSVRYLSCKSFNMFMNYINEITLNFRKMIVFSIIINHIYYRVIGE